MDNWTRGVITKGVGGFYTVDAGGKLIVCRARGRFRRENIVPTTGDRVLISVLPDGGGRLERIEARRNVFSRPAVSNIDCMVILASEAPPVADTLLIDAMSASAQISGIQTVLCLNKCDLNPAETLFSIYRNAGFPVYRVSAETGEGVGALCEALSGKVCAFTGVSGVGKSSLLNRMEPGIALGVGEVSGRLGRGRHTTRHVELFRLSCGATVADTPGFSAFELEFPENLGRDGLPDAFPDFAPYIGKCRYTGCRHIRDRGCAVREAAEEGRIEKSRYESYVRLYERAEKNEETKYR